MPVGDRPWRMASLWLMGMSYWCTFCGLIRLLWLALLWTDVWILSIESLGDMDLMLGSLNCLF